MKKLWLIVTVILSAFVSLTGCDMEYIKPSLDTERPVPLDGGDDPGISEEEMQTLEREGHYLKLLNMPLYTQERNISSCEIHNSASSIGEMAGKNAVKIYKKDGRGTVYINLVYSSDGAEFLEDGSFYVSLAVYIDALTWIDLKLDAGVIVPFTDGRGVLDVLTLPEGAISPQWPVTPPGGDGGAGSGWWGDGDDTPEEIIEDIQNQVDEMEANGHYVRLYHLPAGTLRETISGVGVSDGSKNVAVPDAKTPVLLAPDGVYINAYIPLVTPSNGEFTRTGTFYVYFTVHVDALTKIVVTIRHDAIVAFDNGKGTLDIERLLSFHPEAAGQTPDPDTEQAIADIISSGSYIRFYNIPQNVSKNSFSNIAVSSSDGIKARPADYETIVVRKGVLNAEAFVPISGNKNPRFTETGSFYVSFSIIIDALTKIIVQPSYASLYTFDDGIADVDISFAPAAPSKPPIFPHCLSIGGLPGVTSETNIFDVIIYNSAGIVAKCPDYTKIYLTPYNGKQTAVIPLVYDNNKAFNGRDFNDNGNFIVTFIIYPDANNRVVRKL